MPLAYDVNILRSIAFKMLHVPKKTSLINSYFKKAKIKTKANKQKLKTPQGPTCLFPLWMLPYYLYCKQAKIERA